MKIFNNIADYIMDKGIKSTTTRIYGEVDSLPVYFGTQYGNTGTRYDFTRDVSGTVSQICVTALRAGSIESHALNQLSKWEVTNIRLDFSYRHNIFGLLCKISDFVFKINIRGGTRHNGN